MPALAREATPRDREPAQTPAAAAVDTAAVAEQYGKLAMNFEKNVGQTDPEVRFLSRGSGYTLFLTDAEAVLALGATRTRDEDGRPGKTERAVLRMRPVGAAEGVRAAGAGERASTSNYLVGQDESKWRTDVPNFAEVRYDGVYPGVDLVYYGNQQQLEYDFVVAPRVDPGAIEMAFDGAEKVEVDADGGLVLTVGGREMRQGAPVLFQEGSEGKRPVAGSYVMKGERSVGFACGDYDADAPLTIDPVIAYSAYLGGAQGLGYDNEAALAIALDSTGAAYVTGWTEANSFPTLGAIDTTVGGPGDAFVTKLAPSGSAIVYSTYLGGSSGDTGRAIAVDQSGAAYVAGTTDSADFPTVGAFDATIGRDNDLFVAKLNPVGSALVYSTFVGGNNIDNVRGVAVNAAGALLAVGSTRSTDFPLVNGLFPSRTAPVYGDAFMFMLAPSGASLEHSTLIGGERDDVGSGIALDAAGAIYLSGYTTSSDFPTLNAFDSTGGSSVSLSDGFVMKIDASGSNLVFSTYLGGGDGSEDPAGIAVDAVGSVYVAGWTTSNDFPTANAIDAAFNESGARDGFVTKFSPAGDALVYSTYYGGRNEDYANAIAVDGAGAAYITGPTKSTDLPLANAFDASFSDTFNLRGDCFVAKINAAGSALDFSTYLGGTDYDVGNDIAVDASGSAYVTGETVSTNFPTANAFDDSANGGSYYSNSEHGGDVFVTKFSPAGNALTYSTYLGGGGPDYGNGVFVDAAGSAYVTGDTEAPDFPTANAYDTTYSGQIDAFVTKLDPSGSSVVFSTYLGGFDGDRGKSVAVDAAGAVYVAGETDSPDFPVAGGYPGSTSGADVFVTKLSPSGNALVYSARLGGSSSDSMSGLAVDNSGAAYVAGSTASNDFPTTGTISPRAGYFDAFVTKFAPGGASLAYSYIVGGSADDTAHDIAVDTSGAAYVVGTTNSENFPAVNAYDGTPNGLDAFVFKVHPTSASLVYSTYLGGSGNDRGWGIAVDASGSAYVAGDTASTNFPTLNAADGTFNGGYNDAFVVKFGPSGNALLYATFVGGTLEDYGLDLAVDTSGAAYLTGWTKSANFTLVDAFDSSPAPVDAFVTKLSPSGGQFMYSSLLGGRFDDYASGIAVDPAGAAYVVGWTSSDDLSAVSPALEFQGNYDAFVTKVSAVAGPVCTPPSIQTQPASQQIASGQSATLSVSAQGTNLQYQWFRGASGETTNPIAGATSASYASGAITATTSYWVRVSNECGAANSATATVTIAGCALPEITAQPASQTIAPGQSATLAVTATSGSALAYQWYAGTSGDTGNPISGATAPSYTTPALTASATYWVRVTNACGSVDSATAVVSVAGQTGADLLVNVSSSPDAAAPGDAITYTATVINAGPDAATEAVLSLVVPSNAAFESIGAAGGWNCTGPAVGSSGEVTCRAPSVPSGTSAAFALVVRVNEGAQSGSIVTVSATIASAVADPASANNVDSESTPVVGAVTPPAVTRVAVVPTGNPFRIKIQGANFQPGVRIFVGSDATPWANVKYKNATTLVLKEGRPLKQRFPKGQPVTIRVVNPDGGEVTTTFTR